MTQKANSLRRSLKMVFNGIGLYPGRVRALKNYRRYRAERQEFLRQGGTITSDSMILYDFADNAGTASGDYFHQDLLVAKLVYEAQPRRHIDVASRVDGFVAHLACFREVEVVDVRPLPASVHTNIKFVQADLTQPQQLGKADSVSCLHAIEHFGLGRYSDPIDVDGHNKGVHNLIDLTEVGGRLYLSFPIGRADEVQFNEQRVFHPEWILRHPGIAERMTLVRFDYVDDQGDLHLDCAIEGRAIDLDYGCGIFTFEKLR